MPLRRPMGQRGHGADGIRLHRGCNVRTACGRAGGGTAGLLLQTRNARLLSPFLAPFTASTALEHPILAQVCGTAAKREATRHVGDRVSLAHVYGMYVSLQAHGGAGVSQDFVLARLWTAARTLRIADGPDEVHLGTIAKMELGKHSRL